MSCGFPARVHTQGERHNCNSLKCGKKSGFIYTKPCCGSAAVSELVDNLWEDFAFMLDVDSPTDTSPTIASNVLSLSARFYEIGRELRTRYIFTNPAVPAGASAGSGSYVIMLPDGFTYSDVEGSNVGTVYGFVPGVVQFQGNVAFIQATTPSGTYPALAVPFVSTNSGAFIEFSSTDLPVDAADFTFTIDAVLSID